MSATLKCAKCGSANGARVIDKRDNARGNIIRRRRRCLECRHTWTTYEAADSASYDGLIGTGPFKLKLLPHQWKAIADGRAL